MSKEIGRDISIDDVADSAEFHLHRVFDPIAKVLSQNLASNA
jgi:hypothetical protein